MNGVKKIRSGFRKKAKKIMIIIIIIRIKEKDADRLIYRQINKQRER